MLFCESQCLVPSVTGEWLLVDNWYSNQSDYRICPVQATYLLLLAVLPWIILVESWDFPLHQVLNMVPLDLCFITLPSIYVPNRIPHVLIIQCSPIYLGDLLCAHARTIYIFQSLLGLSV